jgi:hypothetical protein
MPEIYLSNSASTVPSEREVLGRPNISSIFVSSMECEKPEKTDDCLSIDGLRGEAGTVP